MCGICGVVQVRGEPRRVLEPGLLDHMTDAMTHRGPDDRGTYEEPGIAIGVRRLSVVDVAGGHQPFANEDGSIWAAQNGELYNHADIRRRLVADGHRLRSRCDTEILPHLYETDGPELVHKLRGMFGLVVWDERRRRAVIARDRLGIKPLYYAQAGDLLVFASELKSVLASGLVPLDLDLQAISAYLTLGYVPAPRTPLTNVKKLEPGHRLVVDGDGVRNDRYWAYPEPAPNEAMTMESAAAELLDRLDASVRMRLMADVPLGAMLSGGLDSSLIVALMARHMTEPLKTFSVGFVEAGDENELADARAVAGLFGADHTELELSMANTPVDLADLIWHLDEPVADLSSLGFLALCRLAAADVTVALSGQGADELLGGYTKHRAAALCATWDHAPRFVRRPVETVGSLHPKLARPMAALKARDPVERLLAMSGRADTQLMRDDLARLDVRPAMDAVAARLGSVRGTPLSETLYLDAQLALVDDMLHYFDRGSMAHSLEVRVPFLDHQLVEFCATVPDRLKVHRLRTKAVLKEVARGIVPDTIIDKRKIGFFRGAVDEWFTQQASGLVGQYLLPADARYGELLDRAKVAALVRGRNTGAPSDAHHLLSILMLEVWLSEFLPRATKQPEATREAIRLTA